MSKYIHITGYGLGAPSFSSGWEPGFVCYVIVPGIGTGNTSHPMSCRVLRGVIVELDDDQPSDIVKVRVGKQRHADWYEMNELYVSPRAADEALAKRADEAAESYRNYAEALRQRALTG